MNAVTHAYTAAMMQAYPTCTACGVDQRIQQRPIGNGIAAIEHGFGFAVGACNTSGIEMIAANNNRRLHFSGAHKFIECETCFFSFTLSEPAYAGRQSLE